MSVKTEGKTVREANVIHNYVNGQWVRSKSERTIAVSNPATGEILCHGPLSNSIDLDEAVAAARAALPAWRSRPVIQRAQFLHRLRHELEARDEEIARSVTTEMGKTINDARAEVARMIEMVEAATAVPQTMQGRVLENVAANVDCETIRQPVGVCAAITPFNFPAMVPMWFLPFAIGCGNTFILKPSEQDPLTQQLIFSILHDLELPPGVVNLVNGAGDVVDAILASPGIDAVSFVGSASVARHVYQRAAATGKRVQALGGAKNHLVVMPDAVLDKTADNIVSSAFGAAGQRCMAGSVLVAVGDAWAALRPRLLRKVEELTLGDGMDPAVTLGPVISPTARDRILESIDAAVTDGASLATGGRAGDASNSGGGAFLLPTIIENVAPHSAAIRDEIFGPVLTVAQVASLEEAIDLVNASDYGNGTSIFTESGAAARRYRSEVDVGMVGINVGVAAPVAFFPFTGWKSSFFGDLHAHGQDAIEFFTRKKTVTSRWFSAGETGRFFVE